MPGNSTLHPEEKQELQGAVVAERFWSGAHQEQVELCTLTVRARSLPEPLSID